MSHVRIIDLPFWRARYIAQAILPHVSDDDVTPVLTMGDIQGPYLVGTDRYSVGRILLQDPVATEQKPDPDRINRAVKFGGVSRERHEAELADWARQVEVRLSENGQPVNEFEESNTFIPRGALTRLSTLHKGLTLHSPERARVLLTLTGLTSAGSMQKSPETPYLTVEVVEPLGREERMVTYSQTWVAARGNYPPVGRLIDPWEPDDGTAGTRFSLMPSNLAKITRFAGRHQPFILEAGKGTSQHKMAPMRIKIGKDFTALLQPNLITEER